MIENITAIIKIMKVHTTSAFSSFPNFRIWKCYIFNGNVTLPYSSQCEDCRGISLLEKFSHYLSEINQNSYHAILRKVRMLHSTSKQIARIA